MEAHKNYIDFNELVSSIARIANNLDQMTEIMTTTSVKVTPDQDLDELHPINEVIQDLKLENDRLKKRDEIAQHFIKSVRCKGLVCENCDLHFLNDQGTDLCAQVDHVKLEAIASNILKKMEEL